MSNLPASILSFSAAFTWFKDRLKLWTKKRVFWEDRITTFGDSCVLGNNESPQSCITHNSKCDAEFCAALREPHYQGEGFQEEVFLLTHLCCCPVISGSVSTSIKYREEIEERTMSIIWQTFLVQGMESYNKTSLGPRQKSKAICYSFRK